MFFKLFLAQICGKYNLQETQWASPGCGKNIFDNHIGILTFIQLDKILKKTFEYIILSLFLDIREEIHNVMM